MNLRMIVFTFFLGTVVTMADETTLTFIPGTASAPELSSDRMVCPMPTGVKPALPMKLVSDELRLGKKILGHIQESLEVIPKEPWKILKKTTTCRIVSKSMSGLTWQRDIQTDKNGCIIVKNRIVLPKNAPNPVQIYKYIFSLKEGKTRFDTYAYPRTNYHHAKRAPEIYKLHDLSPYIVFHTEQIPVTLQFYLPNWLNRFGTIEVFTNTQDDQTNLIKLNFGFRADNTLQQIKKVPSRKEYEIYEREWQIRPKILVPGECLEFSVRLGLFGARKHLGLREDIQLSSKEVARNKGVPNDRFDRGEMLCMGFPLPQTPTPKTGHFWTLPWNEIDKDLKILDHLAAAGTEAIVFRSPDFQDISHGVSWDGSYDQVPPNISKVLQRTHELGIKALWWVSVRGVLAPAPHATRNNGRGDPLLKTHPDWFLPGYYWFGMYQHASWLCKEWNDWLLAKLRRDLETYPLDGFAFDEPYFLGIVVGEDKQTTHARAAYEFLTRLRKMIKGVGRPTIMIANYPAFLHDEWKFYDYLMMEGGNLGWVSRVTLGKSCGSWPRGAEHFTFDKTLNLIAYNFAEDNRVLGWTHPSWVFNLHKDPKANKAPEDIARLLSIVGKGNRLWAAEVAPGVRQIEAMMTSKREMLILCNLNDTPAEVLIRLHAIESIAKDIDVNVDTKNRTEKFRITWDRNTKPTLKVIGIPPKAVITLSF